MRRDWRRRSDTALVEACLRGDDAAWAALISRYEGLLLRIPRRLGLSQADAEDVFQSASLKLCLHLPTLKDPERLPGWLAAVARQECLRLLRRTPTEPLENPDGPTPSALTIEAHLDAALIAAERTERLHHALSALPAPCQRLLGHLYPNENEPDSYAQIAAALGIPVGSIGPQRARCLERLRKIVEEEAL